ncbi:MAG: YciI family protein [Gammaproteobacteria bacterium]
MAQYIICYFGGDHPSSPEAAKQHFAKYKQWLESLGDIAVSLANPLKDTRVINPDGSVVKGSGTAMSGFTVIEADSLEAALEVGRRCPFLEIGGSLEVSELLTLSR